MLLDYLQSKSLDDAYTLQADGMRGYSGVAVDKTPFGRRKVRYSVWLRDRSAWLFAATAREHADFYLLEPTFEEVVRSLDTLDAHERQLAQPLRLKVIRATRWHPLPGCWLPTLYSASMRSPNCAC